MKQFSQFGIKPNPQGLIGDKIKMNKVLNREIIVHAFKIEDSKFGNGKKCLYMQIEINDTKHVVFTGSKSLMEMIQRVPQTEFPFKTTIVTENEMPQFS
jgi:ribosomal protein L31